MAKQKSNKEGITVTIPGRRSPLAITQVVLDFNGTLAVDGKLIPGVAARIRRLAKTFEVVVMTADTFGSARTAMAGIPVRLEIVQSGAEKRRFVESVGARRTAAIGNGVNDAPMVRAAGLGIAVIGEEGCAGVLIRAADIVVRDILSALDLLLEPKRLVATLRR